MTRAASFADARRDWRRRGAFTLLELLVVIAIILILMSLTMYVVRIAIVRTRVTQTRTEIVQIAGALALYFRRHGAYPPDTRSWNEATFDPRSIHRYLGRDLVDPKTGKTLPSHMGIPSDRLVDRDADGVGVYVDHWGNPFELDAMHTVFASGRWQKTGEPYLASRTEAERIKDCKVMSRGPDGKTDPAYPFDSAAPHPDAVDDIRSW